MAGSKGLRTVSYEADANLSALQYHMVALQTDGQVKQATATTSIAGILQDDPDTAGDGALVAIGGISKCVVDGNAAAIAAGDMLASDASGQGVKTDTDKDQYGAIAQEASTAAGDIIQVLVTPGQLVSAT